MNRYPNDLFLLTPLREGRQAIRRLMEENTYFYSRPCVRGDNKPRLGWCSAHLDREGPDDFCSYGERSEVT